MTAELVGGQGVGLAVVSPQAQERVGRGDQPALAVGAQRHRAEHRASVGQGARQVLGQVRDGAGAPAS